MWPFFVALLIPLFLLYPFETPRNEQTQEKKTKEPQTQTQPSISKPPPKTLQLPSPQKTIAPKERPPKSKPTKSERIEPKQRVEPQKARVKIRFSSIPWGAKVWVDHKEIGTTLISGHTIYTGKHHIKMTLGDSSIEKTIELKEKTQGYSWHVREKTWKEIKGQ